MKIQVINYSNSTTFCDKQHSFEYSTLSEPLSLDAFDLNIIMLQNSGLWSYHGPNTDKIDSLNDFVSLKHLLDEYKKTKVIICFPLNYKFIYNPYGTYTQYTWLKDMIVDLQFILTNLLPNVYYNLTYENSVTICGQTELKAAFYFNHNESNTRSITQSKGSEKPTTLLVSPSMFFTTLDISGSNIQINDFLKAIGLVEQKSDTPTWIDDFKFFDDDKQDQIMADANTEIEKQKQIIFSANQKKNENLHYKSVLYENGEALVKVVFEILEKMLNYDLFGFIDKKEEDFKIVLPDVTFYR